MDKAFRDQINRVSPPDVPGPTRVRYLDLAAPGDGPNDQPAARGRVEALKALGNGKTLMWERFFLASLLRNPS